MRTEFKSFPMTLVHETWCKFVSVETLSQLLLTVK